MKDQFLIIKEFKNGWQVKEDESRIPIGAGRKSVNIQLTDRGGIGPRPGEILLGTINSATSGINTLWSFKKTDRPDILIKTYADKIEYFNNKVEDWCLLNDGYTNDLDFGFKEHRTDADAVDLVYFGNGVDPYSRWCGYEAETTAPLVGGETSIPVDTTLLEAVNWTGTATSVTTNSITVTNAQWGTDIWNFFYVRITSGAQSGQIRIILSTGSDTITFRPIVGLAGTPTFEIRRIAVPNHYWSDTSTVTTTTTIDVAGTPWPANLWIDSYVLITSGAQAGQISQITANTTNQITFAAIAGLAGTPTFEIQQHPFYETRTLVYGNNQTVFTEIPTDSSFTVGSASAAATGTGVTVLPEEFPEDPRGNILETSVAQMFVAGVLASPDTVYRSHITDATDFTFADPRAADEGDVIFFPYGGGSISDIKSQEDLLYVIKRDSIEQLTYTQDALDIQQVKSIKNGANVGTEARAWRMDDDIAFCTPDNTITTIGRIKLRDVRPQSSDIAYPIRRAVKRYNFDDVYGEEYVNRAFVCCKSNFDTERNDIMIVRNKDYQAWEGVWLIPAATVIPHDGDFYYGASYSADVYKMLTGINRVREDDIFPVTCIWQSGWINARGTGFYLNEVSSLAVEGYISGGTTINFKLYKDFATSSFQDLQLQGTETQYLDGSPIFSFLGGEPDGLYPLGTSAIIGDPDESGRRHFIVFFNFPETPVEYVSVECSSSGLTQDWEVIALGLNATEEVFEAQERQKN